jgi:hypothetical protein
MANDSLLLRVAKKVITTPLHPYHTVRVDTDET